MSAIKKTEEDIIDEMINELLKGKEIIIPQKKFEKEDNKIKFKILQIMFKSQKKEDILVNNIKNMMIGSNIRQMIKAFIKSLQTDSIENCIIAKDTISNYYYRIKDDETFKLYISKMKNKIIPFFQVVKFIAFVNSESDISDDILNLISENSCKILYPKIYRKRASFFS